MPRFGTRNPSSTANIALWHLSGHSKDNGQTKADIALISDNVRVSLPFLSSTQVVTGLFMAVGYLIGGGSGADPLIITAETKSPLKLICSVTGTPTSS